MAIDQAAGFALDVQSLQKIKHTAASDRLAGLEDAAQQFEAVFLQKMLQGMRDTIPKSGLLHSDQTETYGQMMDQQWAQTMAKRGIGLADMMTRQMRRSESAAEPQPPLSAAGNLAGTASQPLIVAEPGTQPSWLSRMKDVVGQGDDRSFPAHVTEFVERMGSAAKQASQNTGLPAKLILAQVALETGWGKHESMREDGRPSFNVFNIKSHGWAGETTRIMTHEFEGGERRSRVDAFRAYNSYDESFGDYARLISESPRYAGVMRAPDAPSAARALQDAGYATDPAYADKLISIMKGLPDTRSGPQPLFATQATGALFEEVAADDNRVAAIGAIGAPLTRLHAAPVSASVPAAPAAPAAPEAGLLKSLF